MLNSKRLLWDVLNPSLWDGWLLNVFIPFSGKWLLGDILDVSILHGRWLVDVDVFHWVGGRHDCLNSLVGLVLNIFPVFVDDSVVIEWVGVIEVLVGYDWLTPGAGHDRIVLHNNVVVVWIVVEEVSVVEVSVGNSGIHSGDGWVLHNDGIVIVWVGVVEVGI